MFCDCLDFHLTSFDQKQVELNLMCYLHLCCLNFGCSIVNLASLDLDWKVVVFTFAATYLTRFRSKLIEYHYGAFSCISCSHFMYRFEFIQHYWPYLHYLLQVTMQIMKQIYVRKILIQFEPMPNYSICLFFLSFT
jgi:hypothetical protein